MDLQNLTIAQKISVISLLLNALWGCCYIAHAILSNRIKSRLYKHVLVATLALYTLSISIHLSFMFVEYDPLRPTKLHVLGGLRSIASASTFLAAVGIDTMVLQLFRVLDPRITIKRLTVIRTFFAITYIISVLLTALNMVINREGINPTLFALHRFGRVIFIISVCLFDEAQNVLVTMLVYSSLVRSEHRSRSLKKLFGLICLTYPVDLIGAISFVLAETMTPSSSLWEYRFFFLNGSMMTVGIHLNFMVVLFSSLVNMTFSEKGQKVSNLLPSAGKRSIKKSNN
jgi:hypothetical protein